MDSLSTSFGIQLGHSYIDCLLLEEIDLRIKVEIYLQIERKNDNGLLN